MNQQWIKLGQLYDPNKTSQRHPKLITHAANPLPVHLDGDIYRIFYSGRDEHNRSSVGAVDIDIIQRQIVEDHYCPFFEHGPEGSFYADGVSIGNCYEVDGVQYMLFMGWQAPSNGHWRGDIGRLIVTPELSLKLDSTEPFLGSNHKDPISLSYPWVQPNPLNGFDMWYGSTLSWDAGNNEMLHTIHYAQSDDGHIWRRLGLAVPYQLGVAQAFSRPTIASDDNGMLHLWFSYRSGSGVPYRIGYASSTDYIHWELDLKNSGINVSDNGWDSEMIEYPFVFTHNKKRYMLYNGNGFGKSGFGLAIMNV